jgi:hypothetical protein
MARTEKRFDSNSSSVLSTVQEVSMFNVQRRNFHPTVGKITYDAQHCCHAHCHDIYNTKLF